MNYPQTVLNLTLDTIFPVKCLGCGKLSSQKQPSYVCGECIRSIPIKKQSECVGCKATSPLGQTCFNCKKDNYLDQLLIVTDYKNPLIVKVIKTFKYRLIANMIGPISLLTKKYILWLSTQKKYQINSGSPLIVPVPLFYRRLNWRGFNQAELIAKSLANMLQTNYQPDLLLRIKESKPQADISDKSKRIKNPANIFQLNKGVMIKDRTVIMVDDICTTGATLNECARVLKENGAKKVVGLVFARG